MLNMEKIYHMIFNIYIFLSVINHYNLFEILFLKYLAAPLLFPVYFQFMTIRHAIKRQKWMVRLIKKILLIN